MIYDQTKSKLDPNEVDKTHELNYLNAILGEYDTDRLLRFIKGYNLHMLKAIDCDRYIRHILGDKINLPGVQEVLHEYLSDDQPRGVKMIHESYRTNHSGKMISSTADSIGADDFINHTDNDPVRVRITDYPTDNLPPVPRPEVVSDNHSSVMSWIGYPVGVVIGLIIALIYYISSVI